MKRAAIFKFEDRYVIHSTSTGVDGYGIASDPDITIAVVSTMQEFVKSLLYALEGSKTNVLAPNQDTFLKEHLKFMGVKNHKSLYENSICCSVHEKDNEIIFSPSINIGFSGGFRHCHDRKVIVSADATTENYVMHW